jgi:hypothetical protein
MNNQVVSLNFEDLDVEELERRLELAVTAAADAPVEPLGWCILT